jgi:hypothetical protein
LGTAERARRRGDADGPALLVAATWFTGGAVLTAALGYIDVRLRSPDYLRELSSRVNLQYSGLAIACIVAVCVAAFAPRLVSWPARAARGRLGDVAGLVAGGAFFAMWFLRPRIQHTRGRPHAETLALQAFDHVKHDPFLHYSEYSMRWQSWYVGPLALAAGIVGVALLVRAIVRGRAGRQGFVVVTFLGVAAVYLWNPSIFPDQIWVMRRYLPIVVPGFILFAFVVVELLYRRASSPLRKSAASKGIARGAALVLAVVAMAWPIHTAWPVRGETTEHGFLGSIDRLCHLLGPNAAVVVLNGGNLQQVLPQTLRSFCGVPAAISEVPGRDANGPMLVTAADLVALAGEWKRDGRTLFVIADSQETIGAILPGLPGREAVGAVDAVNPLFLEARIVARPDGFQGEAYRFVVAEVPLRSAGAAP